MPANSVGEIAQGDRDRGADDLVEDGGVGGQPRRDFRRTVFLEEAGRKGQQVPVHRDPQVRDRPLANPGKEIEAKRRGERERRTTIEADNGRRRDSRAAPAA